MKSLEFYLKKPLSLFDVEKSYVDSDYVAFGVPYDYTSTYRPGSRFGPKAIREASANIEANNIDTGCEAYKLKVCDVGDVEIVYSLRETIKRVRHVCSKILLDGKIPVMIGGEHTFTYAALTSFKEDVALIMFDAHFDMRDEFMGSRWNHATFLRRIVQKRGIDCMVVGIRAFEESEIKAAEEKNVKYITSESIAGKPVLAEKKIREFCSIHERIYVSIDLDFIDPAFAPGVSNPEPHGVTVDHAMSLIKQSCDEKVVGFDVMEVCPMFDQGQSALLAAKIIADILCLIDRAKRAKT